jgi:hypothetical protein
MDLSVCKVGMRNYEKLKIPFTKPLHYHCANPAMYCFYHIFCATPGRGVERFC